MEKDDLVYAGHMLDTARLVVNKVRGLSREQFEADENLRLALAHLIQVMGEAARKTTPEFRERHGDIPWAKIIGMRHRVVHDYLYVDYDIVWHVATENLSNVISGLERLFPTEST